VITEPSLLDAGPLVALLHRDDAQHFRCRDQAAEITGPVLTCWSVLTEAAWLLRKLPDGLQRLLQTIVDRDIVGLDLDREALAWVVSVANQYHDLSPQLADLSLLYLAKQRGIHTLFTLDRRDFTVYRQTSGEPFRLLPETG
jgi:predicted nucleic acid-binding protein